MVGSLDRHFEPGHVGTHPDRMAHAVLDLCTKCRILGKGIRKEHRVEEEMSKMNGKRKDKEIVKDRGTKVLFVSCS